MNTSFLIIALVLVVLVFFIMLLARLLQSSKISETSAKEQLIAKQSELESLLERCEDLSKENTILKADFRSNREELIALQTRLELEEKQFDEADKVRDEIAIMGISLIDHKSRTIWMKKEAIKAEK